MEVLRQWKMDVPVDSRHPELVGERFVQALLSHHPGDNRTRMFPHIPTKNQESADSELLV